MYVLMGLIYTLIGIPMIVFGGAELKIVGLLQLLERPPQKAD